MPNLIGFYLDDDTTNRWLLSKEFDEGGGLEPELARRIESVMHRAEGETERFHEQADEARKELNLEA